MSRKLKIEISAGNLAHLIDPFLRQLKHLHGEEEISKLAIWELPEKEVFTLSLDIENKKVEDKKVVNGWLPENAGPPISSDLVKRDMKYLKDKEEVKYIVHNR